MDVSGAAIDKALTSGQSALSVYDRMAQVAVSDEQGVNILKQLEACATLSGTLRSAMETFWLAPRRAEDKARNLYNLYNAVTEHLREVRAERYEYADKVSNQVLLRLENAARNPATLGKLILPVPKDLHTTVTVDASPVAAAAGAVTVEAEIVG